MAVAETVVFVYLAEGPVPAGRLILTEEARNASATFTYGRRYLERPDRIPVDPVMLPLPEVERGRDVEFVTPEGFGNFNGVRDAAPDGWGRYLMYKAMDDRTPTDIDALLASGDDRVGTLAFGPTPERPQRITPWGDGAAPGERFSLEELAEAVEQAQEVDQLDENLRRMLTAGSSLGGARPKAATELDGQPWLAKFPARDDTYPMCRVELATMRLAAECGLDVPRLDYRQAFDRDIYLIERFDRRIEDGKMVRRPFVSGLTLLGAHESEVSRYSYADLADALRRYGGDVRSDLTELYRRMVFNVVVTNDDDHLRNHGFLLDARGWRLSPLYDVVPKPQAGRERYQVLGVGPAGRLASLENLAGGAAAFHLDAVEAQAHIERVTATVRTRWRDLYAEAGVNDADIRRFATCFRLADPALDALAAPPT